MSGTTVCWHRQRLKKNRKNKTFQNIRKRENIYGEKADVSFVFSYGAESWRTGAYGDSSDQGESPSGKCAGADRSAPWFHDLRGSGTV